MTARGEWPLEGVAFAGVILQAAGGTLTNFAGSSWYHSPDGGYVASNSIIHGRLLQSAQAVIALRRLAAARSEAGDAAKT